MGLSDSHIVKRQSRSIFDGSVVLKTSSHDLRSGLAVVTGPAAEASDDPSGEGEGTVRMRIALSRGLACELVRDRLEDRLVVGIEGIAQELIGVTVASLDKLLDGDSRDSRGGGEVDHRLRLTDISCFDVETRGLERAEELFDDPAPAIEVDSPAGRGEGGAIMGGQQPPVDRLAAIGRRRGFWPIEQGEGGRGGEST